jgi:hypothetical protein
MVRLLSVELRIPFMVKANSQVAILHSNINTRLRVKATLRKVRAIRLRDKDILSKATHSSNPMVKVHLPLAHPRPWAHHHLCPLAGHNNGIRTASDGTT